MPRSRELSSDRHANFGRKVEYHNRSRSHVARRAFFQTNAPLARAKRLSTDAPRERPRGGTSSALHGVRRTALDPALERVRSTRVEFVKSWAEQRQADGPPGPGTCGGLPAVVGA